MGGPGSGGGARAHASGPVPDPNALRRTRASDSERDTAFVKDGVIRGPALPRFDVCFGERFRADGESSRRQAAVGEDWHPLSKMWYNAMRKSPFAIQFTELDWFELIDMTMTHHLWMVTLNDKYLKAFSQSSAKYGVSPANRQRLRWVVEEVTGVMSEEVKGTSKVKDEVAAARLQRLMGDGK